MKLTKALAMVALLFMGMVNVASAQSDNHVVNVEIQAINEIAIAGDVSLSVSTATAGSDPTAATGGTTYSITTNDNGGTTRITASTSLDPASLGDGPGNDLALKVTATAPTGGTSAGTVTLGTTAANVVTAMDAVSQSGVALGYTLSATAETGQLTSTAITVTYTIVN